MKRPNLLGGAKNKGKQLKLLLLQLSFAEHCRYRMLKEELIRGRIIVGKRDNQFISTTYAQAQLIC